ncbi:MAG: tRNA (adenosine(37)-N6)-threonylcarbamoyltransferase complex dimerization subunit type 1 TsaB [Mesorhizobium sp.]|nr:tRNA (adenosine(37)-N6)-threonylcarbamoyltransferase complex dimerization subunit type 1 TsaB [Mesorhizobium sp.]
MKLLAIDTASTLCAACVYDTADETVLGRAAVDIGKGHAEALMDIIAEALEGAGCWYPDIGAIAVSVGPGSFTGIRVGVSAARGLSLALKVPAHGVTTLSAIAEAARESFPGRRIIAAIDARRGELYVEDHARDGRLAVGPMIVNVEDAASLTDGDLPVLAGSGAAVIQAAAEASGSAVAYDLAAPGATADIAIYARLAASGSVFGSPPKPIYLRAPDARPQDGFALARTPG